MRARGFETLITYILLSFLFPDLRTGPIKSNPKVPRAVVRVTPIASLIKQLTYSLFLRVTGVLKYSRFDFTAVKAEYAIKPLRSRYIRII